ncbi:MAG: polyphosphate kinase 1 [Gammaproteobacteria bacterium]|nr:polyphosphate kinase 1 [Gammaproteobacteria bacterium]
MLDDTDLRRPENFINRELSTLNFQRRVLAQARDHRVPLLERVRFLCISCTNLDEFFEVRVAGLRQMYEAGSVQTGPDNLTPGELLTRISEQAHAIVADQYRVFNDELTPELDAKGIRFVRRTDWTAPQRAWLENYAMEEVFPVLSPLALDPAHPFPRIINKSLNFIVELKGKDAFGRHCKHAVVQAPRALPRLIRLPQNECESGPNDFVFLSSVMHEFMDALFPGMKVMGSHQFRATRNSNLYVDEEEVDDLLRALEGELAARRYGDAVRLEVTAECPDELATYLLNEFGLGEEDLYRVDGPVNINRVQAVFDLVEAYDLKYPPFVPGVPANLVTSVSKFSAIKHRDLLLNHPFESFVPVVEFLREAANDPEVVAIKQTLYRTGSGSVVVDALVEAARAGKEVTAVIELRARFDEADNIELANRLTEAGAHLVYGVVGFKTHTKMCLVLRREGGKLKPYCHLGTGNYHASTAKIYTDYSLFTADPEIGEDVNRLFLQLTGLGKFKGMHRLLQSPFMLHDAIIEKIEREISNAEAGRKARIVAKMNALIEAQVIEALYRASRAGVKVDLIVRGVCALRPGIPGLSENISVRSIVGRFLEHSRVYYFENAGEYELYCSSADWMDRNFFGRVEACFPVSRKKLRERIRETLELYLADNQQAWLLQPSGDYVRVTEDEPAKRCSAQDTLLARYATVM